MPILILCVSNARATEVLALPSGSSDLRIEAATSILCVKHSERQFLAYLALSFPSLSMTIFRSTDFPKLSLDPSRRFRIRS